MYNGFNTKKLQQEYNSLVNKMIILLIDQLSLQLQINQITNKNFFDQQFSKLLNSIKQLEIQKIQPPKFSNLLQPLQFVIQNNIHQMISNNAASNNKPTYIPPILEQDAIYSTQFTKLYNTNERKKLVIKRTQKQAHFGQNKTIRICNYVDEEKIRPLKFSIGEFYADFQNESQILGKKSIINQKFQQIYLNKISKTSLSFDISQQQDFSGFSNQYEYF